jgi:hypothetical protein
MVSKVFSLRDTPSSELDTGYWIKAVNLDPGTKSRDEDGGACTVTSQSRATKHI